MCTTDPMPDLTPDATILGADSRTATLVGSIRAGSESGPVQLCASYWAAVNLAVRRLGRTEGRDRVRHALLAEQDDITNHVLGRACLAIRDGSFEYRGPGSLSAWLLTAVRNQVEDRRRWLGRRPADRLDAEATGAADGGQLAMAGPGPATSLLAKETFTNLREALAQLPLDQQLIIELRFFHGLPWQDVARQFEHETGETIDADALRMRLATIRRRLGLLLDSLREAD